MRYSLEDKSNTFCMKRVDFTQNIDKSVEENKKMVMKQRKVAVYFNEHNNIAFFHYLSCNKVGASTHNLSSLFGLGEKFYPQGERVSFKKSRRNVGHGTKRC